MQEPTRRQVLQTLASTAFGGPVLAQNRGTDQLLVAASGRDRFAEQFKTLRALRLDDSIEPAVTFDPRLPPR